MDQLQLWRDTPLNPDDVCAASEQAWGTQAYGKFALSLAAYEGEGADSQDLMLFTEHGKIWRAGWGHALPNGSDYRLPEIIVREPADIAEVFRTATAGVVAGQFVMAHALQAPRETTSETSGYIQVGKAYDALAITAGVRSEPRTANQGTFQPDDSWLLWRTVLEHLGSRGLGKEAVETFAHKARSLITEQIQTAAPVPPREVVIEGDCLMRLEDKGVGGWTPRFRYVSRKSLLAVAADYPPGNTAGGRRRQTAIEELAGEPVLVQGVIANVRRRQRQTGLA